MQEILWTDVPVVQSEKVAELLYTVTLDISQVPELQARAMIQFRVLRSCDRFSLRHFHNIREFVLLRYMYVLSGRDLILSHSAFSQTGYTIPGQFVQVKLGDGKPAFLAIASPPKVPTSLLAGRAQFLSY